MTTETNQNQEARGRLRAALFDLIQGKLVSESVGLHLLRVVEYTLRDHEPTSIGVPQGMQIIDESGDGTTWRAYPSDETTIEELLRACAAFQLRPWVDLDSRVCLISVTGYGGKLPTVEELADAMYGGLEDVLAEERAIAGQELPAFLRRQAD